ncbi:MAG TPA: DnaJ domain-containing protein, partial [Polyangiaceae bacterium]|nr:DnaJ domain-containing protein [Polyangiaceae bacterium]
KLAAVLRQPRASRAPQSQPQREVTLAPLKPRSSQGPRLSVPPRLEGPPSSAPGSRQSAPAPEELAPVPSRQLGSPGAEHSVVSPELETLLAEAERRVQAQISMQGGAVGSSPPEAATAHLSDDVWDALGEALDDDADNPVGDVLSEAMPPPSPLALDAAEPSLPPAPVAVGDSTIPPGHWPDAVNEDTGPFASMPDSEPTSGSLHPLTAAGKSNAPATLAPGAARRALRDEELPAAEAAAGVADAVSSIAIEAPARFSAPPPSTTPPPPRRRTAEPRPATVPAFVPPASEPPSERGTTGGLRGEPLSGWTEERVPPAPEARVTEARIERAAEPRVSEARGERGPPDERGSPARAERPPERPPESAPAPRLELPNALVRGGAPLVIGRAVRQRFSGCLAFEVDQGLRRVVFKEGDVVIAASAVHGESLVAYLSQRGDLAPETAAQIEHRIPAFGRHAGAALIARGLLEQGELWPVLRGHAEWVLSQVFSIERGTVQIEHPIPERLAAEPAVFGGATGAEVLVEVVERAIPPAQALEHLGSLSATFKPGNAFKLLGECALPAEIAQLVARAREISLEQLLEEADEPILPCVLYALGLLEVLRKVEQEAAPATRAPGLRAAPERDQIDDDALRARVQARRALVDEGDYFALLGVPRQATGYDIRRSYVELRRQFDPAQVLRQSTLDLADDVDTILEVLDEAYEILRDQQRRERYRRAIESMP